MKTFHRKSRTGCRSCRKSRIKCDEARPICRNCQRRAQPCLYDRRGPPVRDGVDLALLEDHAKDSDFIDSAAINCDNADEPQETRDRRILELELMRLYITETGPSIAFEDTHGYDLYVNEIPRMATKSDALLYAVYTIVVLHQTKAATRGQPGILSIPNPATAREHFERYSSLMFKEHRRELANLSQHNVACVYMTVNIMRLYTYVILSERKIEPYQPPLAWLRVVNSHTRIYRAAANLLDEKDDSIIARLLRSRPIAQDQKDGADELNHILQHQPRLPVADKSTITRRSLPITESDNPNAWDRSTRRAYENTLSYISTMWLDVKRNEPLSSIGRALILFPIFTDKRFIELVEERRPRALVILAHYFALLSTLQSFWFIGKIGQREVLAIALNIPSEWQELMDPPLQLTREASN